MVEGVLLVVVQGIGLFFDGFIELAEVGKALFVFGFVSDSDDACTFFDVVTIFEFSVVVVAVNEFVSFFCLFPVEVVVAGNEDNLLWV